MKRKKDFEAQYLEEARRVSSIFPSGEAIPRDPLDFLFRRAAGTLGIEMTELCRDAARAEGGLANVAPRAKALYTKRPDVKPVDHRQDHLKCIDQRP
jgi:hypothetical protein